jgi:DNA-binding beta-propeller fold protein YncE
MRLLLLLFPCLWLARPSTLPADNEPTRETQHHEQILVVSQQEHHLTVLNAETLEIEAQIPTPDGPHEVITSADGALAYVMNYGGREPGHTISIIDARAHKELGQIDLGALRRPHGLARHGDALWITNETNNAVARVDLKTKQVDRILGHGGRIGHMLAFDPASERVYVANMLGNSVSMIETAQRPGSGTVRTVEVAAQPEGIALTPDGTELWLGHRQGGMVTVLDTKTLEVKASIDFGGFAYRLAPTRDGQAMLATCNATGELIAMDIKTHAIQTRWPVGANPAGFCVSPDGNQVAVSLLSDSTITILDLKTGARRSSPAMGASPDGFVWTAPVAASAER